ncbi:MAG: acyl-CoA dehydrogenase family protein [Deltaproteobacteria bacterium]|nr:acyl-CoA dehydrogenase family protein [Deltaproteobacteria bacterium]
MDLTRALLSTPLDPSPIEHVAAWWPRHLAIAGRAENTFERAVRSGLEADRLAWAFASGYRHALDRLVPGLPLESMAALAVTEEAGNTPKAIATRLVIEGDRARVTGDKRWTTLGPHATEILVVARVDPPEAPRPMLRVVRVPAGAKGLVITTMPDTPFVPEIPHASLSLRDVEVSIDAVLLGDGYDRYVKPFRTIEDVHVFGAALGHAIRELRLRSEGASDREAMHRTIELALATIASLTSIAEMPAEEPSTHVALAGAITLGKDVFARLDAAIATADDERAVRLRRDRTLLSIAGAARGKRLERAWSELGPAST